MSKVLDLWAGMTGTVLDFAGNTAPTGWLMCYGQAVSRTTYSQLFDKIGTTYGAGDGSTTFNVPDCRGRVIAGKDNMGGTAASRLTNSGTGNPGIDGATLGAAGGDDRHQLTTGQMPSHSHTISGELQSFSRVNGSGQYTVHQGAGYGNSATWIQSAGSGQSHPNAQPNIVLNKIIKT